MALATNYDAALFDLDGVIYVGPDAVEHAQSSVRAVRELGLGLAYVTNNAARTPDDVAHHLREIGVPATAAEVVTSAQAAASLLAHRLPEGAAVLVVGGDGLHWALRERGLASASSTDDGPSAVAQGFHPDVGWRILAEGSYAVASGLPWVATNTDLTIPTTRGIAPGNGTLVAAVRAATGREPIVAGKPEAPIFHEAVARTRAAKALVVGDRLDTDIAGANRAELDSLLVLTGVTTATEAVLATPSQRPTYVGADLRALLEADDRSAITAGTTSYGGWTATVADGELKLYGGGEASYIDAVRAACGAAWNYGVDAVSAKSVDTALEWAASAVEAIP